MRLCIRYRWFPPLLALFTLAGCIGGGAVQRVDQPPAWLLNPPQRIGSLFGVGSAAVIASAQDMAQKQARIKAVAHITNQIEVTLTSHSESLQSSSTTAAGEDFTSRFERTIESQIPTITLTQLIDKQRYHDQANGTLYLLVELDLDAEITALQQQIDQIDGELAIAELATALNNQQLLANIRQAAQWLKQAKQRQQLQLQVNRLQTDKGSAAEPEWLRRQSNRWRAEIAKLTIRIESSGQDDAQLATQLSQALTHQGVSVIDNDQTVLTLRSSVSFSGKQEEGVYYQFARGRYQILDGEGRTLSDHSAKAKGSSTVQQLAQERAVERLAAELSLSLQQGLLSQE